MFVFRWIRMYLHLILLLQFTAVTRQDRLSFFVRDGGEVTLPCGNVMNDLHNCDSTWLFSRYTSSAAVALFEHGQIGEKAKAKSDRLSVTENCSLVVKKVAAEDVGLYICYLHKSGQKPDQNNCDLSVINMTEHKDSGKVTLRCSVSTRGECRHTVKWLYRSKEVDKDHKDLETSQSHCSANVTFTTTHFIYTSKKYELLKCNVKDGYNKEHQFPFSPEPTGVWWSYIMVAVGLAALLITAVVLIRWKRGKGNKAQMNENTGQSLNHAGTQSAAGTRQDTADPEDGVSYASISHTNKTYSSKVRGGDDTVTYSTVKASCSSAGASADPSNLYATIN